MQFSKCKFLRKLAFFLFYLRNRDVNKIQITYKPDGIHIQVVNIFGYGDLMVIPIK
jgi:hypothetical protein